MTRGMSVAHLFPVDVVSSSSVSQKPNTESAGKLTPSSFNLGDSVGKERLVGKMMERHEVFSTHEFDVGCCKSANHSIKTTEDKPFRERSRQLAPADLEALRQNLSQLKDAGIITESRSLYASPIGVVRKKIKVK